MFELDCVLIRAIALNAIDEKMCLAAMTTTCGAVDVSLQVFLLARDSHLEGMEALEWSRTDDAPFGDPLVRVPDHVFTFPGGLHLAGLVLITNLVRVDLAGAAQGVDCLLGRALTVVAIVEPSLDLVTAQVDLHDTTLQVVEVELTAVDDALRILLGHGLWVIAPETHALRTRTVVQNRQDGRLAQSRNVHFIPRERCHPRKWGRQAIWQLSIL